MSTKSKGVFGTGEWAASNWNIAKGCSHDCRYCYAKAMAIRFGRTTPTDWSTELVDERKARKRWGRREGRIMYPTTHDITPALLEPSLLTLCTMLRAGNDVLIVSKPHLECVERLCAELTPWLDQITFRFTLGSVDAEVLRFWEPGAPPPAERLAALKHAYEHGYATSVSCEPMLDEHVEQVVRAAESYVTDSIWIGKANVLLGRLRLNGADGTTLERGRQLVTAQCDANIRALYARLRSHSLVRWKESIKKVVGIEVPTTKGLDI